MNKHIIHFMHKKTLSLSPDFIKQYNLVFSTIKSHIPQISLPEKPEPKNLIALLDLLATHSKETLKIYVTDTDAQESILIKETPVIANIMLQKFASMLNILNLTDDLINKMFLNILFETADLNMEFKGQKLLPYIFSQNGFTNTDNPFEDYVLDLVLAKMIEKKVDLQQQIVPFKDLLTERSLYASASLLSSSLDHGIPDFITRLFNDDIPVRKKEKFETLLSHLTKKIIIKKPETLKLFLECANKSKNKDVVFKTILKTLSPELLLIPTPSFQNLKAKLTLLNDFKIYVSKIKDKDNNSLLHHATKEGHVDFIQLLIEQYSFQKTDTNRSGQTPSHIAIEDTHLACLEYLNPESAKHADKDGNTLLYSFALKGRTELLELLLLIPDINADYFFQPNNEGISPIELLIKRRHNESLLIILNSPDKFPEIYRPELAQLAAKHSNRTILENLLTEDVSLFYEKDEKSNYPTHTALQHERIEAFKLIFDQLPDEKKEEQLPKMLKISSKSYMLLAAFLTHIDESKDDIPKEEIKEIFETLDRKNCPERIKLLQDTFSTLKLERSPTPELSSPIPTILPKQIHQKLKAISENQTTNTESYDILKFIATTAIRTHKNIKTTGNNTPLHLACKLGFADIVTTFARNKAYETQNTNGDTPTHLAIKHGHLQCLTQLNPSNLSLTNNNGDTPLHIFASEGRTEFLPFLLDPKLGHNLEEIAGIENNKGETFLEILIQNHNDSSLIQILEKHPTLLTPKLGVLAAKYSNRPLIEYIKRTDPKIFIQEHEGRYASHVALKHQKIQAFKLIFDSLPKEDQQRQLEGIIPIASSSYVQLNKTIEYLKTIEVSPKVNALSFLQEKYPEDIQDGFENLCDGYHDRALEFLTHTFPSFTYPLPENLEELSNREFHSTLSLIFKCLKPEDIQDTFENLCDGYYDSALTVLTNTFPSFTYTPPENLKELIKLEFYSTLSLIFKCLKPEDIQAILPANQIHSDSDIHQMATMILANCNHELNLSMLHSRIVDKVI